jgi:hypothetical protein
MPMRNFGSKCGARNYQLSRTMAALLMWRRPLPLPLQAPCGLRCNDAASDILTQNKQ